MTTRSPRPAARERKEKVIATHREARYRFELLDHFEAGIVLAGSEVKSLRAGSVQIADAHVQVRREEAWLVNCHIPTYSHSGASPPDPDRPRKLLLHRTEIDKIARAVAQQGLTAVPLKLFFSGPHVKVLIAIGRGKKLHDKRESIKKREMDRSARRGDS